MKKKKVELAPLPEPLTYKASIGELAERCSDTSFFTSETEDGEYQMSHPETVYKNFPKVALAVDRARGHNLDAGYVYLHARPKRLVEKGYFLRIYGVIQNVEGTKVAFSAKKVCLMRVGSVSIKETWIVAKESL